MQPLHEPTPPEQPPSSPAHQWELSDVTVSTHKHLDTTGGQLWPAAVRCCEYLAGMCVPLGLTAPGVRVLELGAGLGFLGLNVARNLPHAACVCLTEQASGGALDWLRHNISANKHLPHMGHVTSLECDWSDFAPGSQVLSEARRRANAACKCPLNGLQGAQSQQCQQHSGNDSQGSGQGFDQQASAGGDGHSSSKVCDLVQLLSTQWDFIVGSDLIYNHIGSRLLPHVIQQLSAPHTVTLYCHSRHRFDHLDLEFMEQLGPSGVGLSCEEVREPWVDTPPPSPPPLTELFPELRVAVYRIACPQTT